MDSVFITTAPPIRKRILVQSIKERSKAPTQSSSGLKRVAKRRRVESPIRESPPHDHDQLELSASHHDDVTGDDPLLFETPSHIVSHQRRATPSSPQPDPRHTTVDSTPSPARPPINSMDRHPVQQHGTPFIAPQQRDDPVKYTGQHSDAAGPSRIVTVVPEPDYLPQNNHMAQQLFPNTPIHVRPPSFHSNAGPSHLNLMPTLLQQNQISDKEYNASIEANARLNPAFNPSSLNPTSFQLEPTNFMLMHGYNNFGTTQNLDYLSYGRGLIPQ
ncbi:hypothetical protein DXG01_013728, partial [Tephrocybe rancida]